MVNWKTNLVVIWISQLLSIAGFFFTDADIDNIIQIVNPVRNPSRLYLLPQCMMVGGLPFKRILREKPGGQGLLDNVFNFNCG